MDSLQDYTPGSQDTSGLTLSVIKAGSGKALAMLTMKNEAYLKEGKLARKTYCKLSVIKGCNKKHRVWSHTFRVKRLWKVT